MDPSMIVKMLFSGGGVVAAVLYIMLIYRATLSSREDDQIFIGSSERVYGNEQRQLIARITRLHAPIIALIMMSMVLFLSAFSVWAYHGLSS
jgi:hypothetical protein